MIKMKKCLAGMTALVLVLVLATGCSGVLTSMQSTLPPGTGMLKVYATDDPGDMPTCEITIDGLEVRMDGGDEPWVSLMEEGEVAGPFNLIDLDGIHAFLASKVVDAGWYTQLRLHIVDNVLIQIEDDEAQLIDYYAKVPSGKIKLIGPFEVKDFVEFGETKISLDFDVEKSVHKIGAKNQEYSYIFKPVIKLVVIEALEITTPSLPNGGVDTPYNATLEAIDGTPPYTWSTAGTLPSGLGLVGPPWAISGIPGSDGPYTFTVQVEDSSGPPTQIVTQEFSITIAPFGELIITTTSLTGGEVGTPYNATVLAIGGTSPYAWSISTGSILPPGSPVFTLDSTTGTISGTPTTAGDYIFTVEVEDSLVAIDTQELSIHIED